MRLISGSIRSTPSFQLPVLCGIAPPHIRRNGLCLKLAEKAIDPKHLLHDTLHGPKPTARLKSRLPIRSHINTLLDQMDQTSPSTWVMETWKKDWHRSPCLLQNYIPQPGYQVPGSDLPRHQFVQLNRLRTGHGRFNSFLFKIGLSATDRCTCGDHTQTADHVLNYCSIFKPVGDMAQVDDDFREWLSHQDLSF